jgi:hypothetical protein
LKLIKKMKRASLKSYSTTSESDQEEKRSHSWWKLAHQEVKEEGAKTSLQESQDTKEVLYTMYTKDDDLQATGEMIHAYSTKKSSTSHYQARKPQLWDPDNIDTRRSRVKDPKILSEVYKQLVLHPNSYYESKIVQQWQLDRSGPDPNPHHHSTSWSEGEGEKGKGYMWPRRHTIGYTREHRFGSEWSVEQASQATRKKAEVDGQATTEGGGKQPTRRQGKADPRMFGGKADPRMLGGKADPGDGFQYYTLAKTTQEQQLHSFPTDGMATRTEEDLARAEGYTHKVHRPLFEWSEVYPVVKTLDGLLVDRACPGFQSRAVTPLPPIGSIGPARMDIDPVVGTKASLAIAAARENPAVPSATERQDTVNKIHVKLPQLKSRQSSAMVT